MFALLETLELSIERLPVLILDIAMFALLAISASTISESLIPFELTYVNAISCHLVAVLLLYKLLLKRLSKLNYKYF